MLLIYRKETTQPRLEFSPPLESCSDIYTGPTSYLIVTLLFNVLFLRYFPLFLIFHLSLSIVHLQISILFSLSLLDTPLTADWLQACFGTRSDTVVKSCCLVFKYCLLHLQVHIQCICAILKPIQSKAICIYYTLDRSIRDAVNHRTAAYNAGLLSGNMSEYKTSCYALRRAIRAAKRRYSMKICGWYCGSGPH